MSEGTQFTPQDSEGFIQPADREITIHIPNEGTETTHSVTEGNSGAQDSGGNKPPTDMAPKLTPGGVPSGTDPSYSLDKTPSTELQASGPVHNQGKPSSEGEPGSSLAPTLVDLQQLLEESEEDLVDFEEEEVLAAGDDMDTDQHTSSPLPDQQPPSLKP